MNDRIVNLRQARKRKARAERKAEADANAALHGRSKAERTVTDFEAAKARRDLDGHRLDESCGDEDER